MSPTWVTNFSVAVGVDVLDAGVEIGDFGVAVGDVTDDAKGERLKKNF